jgi:hypothetical protein
MSSKARAFHRGPGRSTVSAASVLRTTSRRNGRMRTAQQRRTSVRVAHRDDGPRAQPVDEGGGEVDVLVERPPAVRAHTVTGERGMDERR